MTLDEAARAGRCFQTEYRILRGADSERIVFLQGDVVLAGSQPIRMVGTIMDITERRRRERGREDSLRWLDAVLDQCPVAIILVHGAHGERVQANKHAQPLHGGTAERIQQLADLGLVTENGLPLTGDSHPCACALRGERRASLALSVQATHGEIVPGLLDAAPILDSSGEIQGAVVVFQDITFLQQLDRMRAEWHSVIAHDLRQPVNTIALVAQLVARKKRDPADMARLAEQNSASRYRPAALCTRASAFQRALDDR